MMATRAVVPKVKFPGIPGFGQCGYRIVRGARRGERLGKDECAFVTYVISADGAGVLGVIAPPEGVFWGPGDTIKSMLPAGNPVSSYTFIGGVVFKNC
jgi:hypothetical protein